jgi:hypothetical protein
MARSAAFLQYSAFLVLHSIFPPKAALFSSEVFEKSVGRLEKYPLNPGQKSLLPFLQIGTELHPPFQENQYRYIKIKMNSLNSY